MPRPSLVSRPPPFLPSVCVHNNTQERKTYFADLPIPCIIVNAKGRSNGGGLHGTEATQTPPKIDEGSGDISPITQALLIAFDLHKVFQPPITLQNTLSAVAIHESLAVYFSTMTKHFISVHKLVITLYSKVMKQLNVTRSSPLRVGRGVVLA